MTEHAHRWLIEEAHGLTLHGNCACGATRTFEPWAEEMMNPMLSPRQKRNLAHSRVATPVPAKPASWVKGKMTVGRDGRAQGG